MSSHVSATQDLVKVTHLGSFSSPGATMRESFTVTIPAGTIAVEDFQVLLSYVVGHQQMVLDSIHDQNANDLLTRMVSTISEDAETSVLFPQQEEDLEKIDDNKRVQFMLLSKWVLKVTKPEVKEKLKAKILGLDQAFITLVNEKWGEGIYTSCAGEFDTPLASYEIPSSVLDGCTVETILSTSPDFFPSDADNGFKKLIPIIKMVSPYVSEVARESLDSLKGSIRAAMEKYTPQAIATTLADHSKEEIQSSVEHFDSWVVLAGTL